MARVTVEDCLKNVDNRFDLVMLATKRARQLVNGADPLLPLENDKPTVMALREIAANLVNARTVEARDRAAQVEAAFAGGEDSVFEPESSPDDMPG